MRNLGWKPFAILAALSVVFIAGPANAQIDHTGVLDNVLSRFQAASSSWGPYFIGKAQFLFFGLATISFVWTFGSMAMKRAELGEIMAELIRFVIFVGLFGFFLTEGAAIASAIIKSMVSMGSSASGLSDDFSPSDLLKIGFQILNKVAAKSSIWHPVDAMAGLLVAIVLLCVLAMTAINVLLVQISLWFIAYAGIFILGFGGSRWTSDMAINYFKSVFGMALSLMGMILVIGTGLKILDDFYATSGNNTLQDDIAMLVIAVCLYVLSNRVPALLAGMVTGSAINGAAGMAMASAGGIASTAIAAAAGAAGGASAVNAAVKAAEANLAAGADAPGGGQLSSAGDAPGGGVAGGGSDGGGGGGVNATPLDMAAGDSGGGGGGGGGGGMPANDNAGSDAGTGTTGSAGGGETASSGGGGGGGSGGGGSAGGGGGGGGGGAGSGGSAASNAASAAQASAAGTEGGGEGGGGSAPETGTGEGASGGKAGGSTGSARAGAVALAMETAKILGGAAVGAAGNAISNRIANTTGGRMAAAITAGSAERHAERLASAAGAADEPKTTAETNAPDFAGDAIEAGPGQVAAMTQEDADDELAAFEQRATGE